MGMLERIGPLEKGINLKNRTSSRRRQIMIGATRVSSPITQERLSR
jgi:hypothetical protein